MYLSNEPSTAAEIAKLIAKSYRVPLDGVIKMKDHRSNLFELELWFVSGRLEQFRLEQFEDAVPYEYPPGSEFEDLNITIGRTAESVLSDSPIKFMTHAWIRLHPGEFDNFVELISLKIQQSAELYRGHIYYMAKHHIGIANELTELAKQIKL